MKKRFAIVRILGNELPPRDRPGQRLEVLRFQLETEPVPDDVLRLWVLNRVHEPAFRAAIAGLLDAAGERWVELPFVPEEYARGLSRRARLLYAISVNAARNLAIEAGRAEARFSLVLDGDCWMGPREWELLTEAIERDQARRPDRRYYSLPMLRATFEEALAGRHRQKLREEPQLVFRDDAELRFDESRVFGDKDKVELLLRLGHAPYSPGGAEEHSLAPDAPCASAGRVIHLQTGVDATEDNRIERGRQRELSLRRLLRTLDERCGAPRGPMAAVARLLERAPKPEEAELTAVRYRAEFRSFDAGDGLSLVYGSTGRPRLLAEPLRIALSRCQSFKTLRGHVALCLRAAGVSGRPPLRDALRRWRAADGLPPSPRSLENDLLAALEILRDDGLFIAAEDVLALCRRREPPPPIASLLLVAGGPAARTEDVLREALAGAREGPLRVSVCPLEDDERLRESCRRLARESGAGFQWLDRPAREELAARLAAGGADPEAAAEAVLGRSAGAARNALILSATGSLALMLDDDADAPAPPSSPALAEHERWLGKEIGPDVFALEQLSSEALRRLREGRGRLRASFRAAVPARADGRLCRDRALRDRQLRRLLGGDGETPGLGGASLTQGLDLECGELGLDLRDGLLPFPAGIDGEDGPFADALAACYDRDLFARLPGARLRPVEVVRRFPADRSSKTGLTAAQLLSLLLSESVPARAMADPAERRRALADRLAALAASAPRDLAAIAAGAARRQAAAVAQALERAAVQARGWPHLRADELRQEAERLLLECRRRDLAQPLDAPSLARAAAGYARLLSHWPALARAAAASAREGARA